MIIKYNNFLTEKLGVNSDVIVLSHFIMNEIKNNNFIITKNIPETTFKIHKIIIKPIKSDHVRAGFNVSYSKLTKDGYIIYIMINKGIITEYNELKNALYHELTHVIKFQNLTNKKLKLTTSYISNYPDKRFKKLIHLLYYSDDSEINAKVAEIYSEIENEIDYFNGDKNYFFTKYIEQIYSDDINPKTLINYDIFNDLSDISDKDKIKFFNHLVNIKKIKNSNDNNFIKIIKMIKYILFNKDDNSQSLNQIMKNIQFHINKQGTKLDEKIKKLYDLI